VDNAPAMLQALVKRITKEPAMRICPLCMDIGDVPIRNASVVVINYTLQFFPLSIRDGLLAGIFEGMVPGGILLMAEKTDHAHPDMSRLQQDFYYRFKKENGYSELEISQKREALETVLVPETVAAHLARLRRIGFHPADLWFQWFNFAAFIARKG
jgi:tRNA (cmo5U34)-methyltransferase